MSSNNKKIITIITDEQLSPDLALRLKNEGHIVYLAAKIKSDILKGTIERIPFSERLDYARKSDLVIYEDGSFNNETVMLREEGISVIGRDKQTDNLELDRDFSNKVAQACGIKTPELVNVKDLDEVTQVITERGGRWVLKQQGKLDGIKGLNFVAKLPDSKDLLDYIPILQNKWIDGLKEDFILQEFVSGHEVAVGSFWNGSEFIKDIHGNELCYENWEHKALFPGNLGESTGEQYTVLRMVKAKDSKIFLETIDKCRELLKKLNFKGYFDINTKITKKGAYFLEFTPRFGVPLTSGQIEIHKSSWYEMLKAMADETQPYKFSYDPRWCVVSWLYTKPFPFVNSSKMSSLYEEQYGDTPPTDYHSISELLSMRLSDSKGIKLNFEKDFKKEDLKHVHMDGVMFEDGLKIANEDGYVVTVTEQAETVEEAGEKVNEILKKIIIPKAFWRNDFATSNYHKSKEDLIDWGYLLSDDKIKKNKEEETKKQNEDNENLRKEARERLKKILSK